MARSLRRPALALVLLAVAGGGATYAYRVETAKRPSATMIPGIVRETEVKIAPEVGGRLDSVRVTAGQRIKKGDVIAVLDSPTLVATLGEARASTAKAEADRANVYAGARQEVIDIAKRNVQIAESNLHLAQQQFGRVDALASQNVQSQQRLDEAAGVLRKAQANLALQESNYQRSVAGPTSEERASADAKLALSKATSDLVAARLAKTTLYAPVDGGVRLIVASPGEVIAPGQAVMTMEAGHERWFAFTLREDRLGTLGIGTPVSLRDAEGHSIAARVTELRALGEFATWRAARAVNDHDINSVLLRAEPVADTVKLEPGMTVWLDVGGSATPLP